MGGTFEQFFYGDCTYQMRYLFNYLIEREELQYALAADANDPLIPGGLHRAPTQSHYNTP